MNTAKHDYELIVGNIGSVYQGPDGFEAYRRFQVYKSQSMADYGRASGESVTLFKDAEIAREHIGKVDDVEV